MAAIQKMLEHAQSLQKLISETSGRTAGGRRPGKSRQGRHGPLQIEIDERRRANCERYDGRGGRPRGHARPDLYGSNDNGCTQDANHNPDEVGFVPDTEAESECADNETSQSSRPP